MPYLVNKENQNNLAYLDFSKYQGLFKQVDYKKFAEYIKASSAIYYRLADPNSIQTLSVSSADQAAGVVEKIRLKTTIEELVLQANLYSKVNEKYLMQSILKFDEQNLEKLISEQDKTHTASTAEQSGTLINSKAAADDESVVSQELYRLVNQHFRVEEPEDEYTEEADATKVAAEDVAQEAEDITEEADAVAESATATEQVLSLIHI